MSAVFKKRSLIVLVTTLLGPLIGALWVLLAFYVLSLTYMADAQDIIDSFQRNFLKWDGYKALLENMGFFILYGYIFGGVFALLAGVIMAISSPRGRSATYVKTIVACIISNIIILLVIFSVQGFHFNSLERLIISWIIFASVMSGVTLRTVFPKLYKLPENTAVP